MLGEEDPLTADTMSQLAFVLGALSGQGIPGKLDEAESLYPKGRGHSPARVWRSGPPDA